MNPVPDVPKDGDVFDPRSSQEQETAFERALNIVTRKYLTQLKNYPIEPLPDSVMNLSLEGTTRFYRLTRFVCEPKEDYLQKVITILYTAYTLNAGVAVVIRGSKTQTEYYFGITTDGTNTKDIGRAIKSAFQGCFPGSQLSDTLPAVVIPQSLISGVKNVAVISGLPGIRDADKHSVESFVQGIENMTSALSGCSYTVIIKANPVNGEDIETLRYAYQGISTQLSPYEKTTYTYNASDTLGSTHTEGTNETTSVTSTQNQTITDNTGESTSISNGKNEAQTKNSGAPVAIGGGLVAATAVAGLAIAATVASGGAMLPALLAAVPSIAAGAASGAGLGGLIGSVALGSETHGANTSETHVNNTSKGTADSNGTSRAETKGSNISDAYSQNRTDGQSKQFTLESKRITDVRKQIDENLKYLNECVNYGGFECATYVVADDYAHTQRAAALFSALMRGDKSSIQNAQVNTWRGEDAKPFSDYIAHLEHPRFRYPLMEEGILLSPTVLESGKELAIHIGLPKRSISGVEVIRHAAFGCNPPQEIDALPLGKLYHMGESHDKLKVNVNKNDLTAHVFITGSTGSGKSNTVYQLLDKLCPQSDFGEYQPRFLVVEPTKGEYKSVFGGRKDVAVYGTNFKYTDLLRINPFSFPEGIPLYAHLDRLIEIFNACWPMYAAMPAVLKDAVERAYVEAGWDLCTSENVKYSRLFPTFTDVLRQIDLVINESDYSGDSKGDYKGALKTRLKSLTNGVYRDVFGCDELSDTNLFDKNVIVDLSEISPETTSLIMGILVLKLQEYRMSSHTINQSLKHITVLEEAHHLLKRTSTEQTTEGSNITGQSVEMLTNAIAEMRTYGECFMIVDQAPGALDPAAIRNTNTKIVLRLPDYSDRELVGKSIGLNDDQIQELGKLQRGVAAVYQSGWIESVLCQFDRFEKTSSLHAQRNEYQPDLSAGILLNAVLYGSKLSEFTSVLKIIKDKLIYKSTLPVNLKRTLSNILSSDVPIDREQLAIIAYNLLNADVLYARKDELTARELVPQFRYLIQNYHMQDEALKQENINILVDLLNQEHRRRQTDIVYGTMTGDVI